MTSPAQRAWDIASDELKEIEEIAMTDLTKITTPFGLLDEATQTALREHGGPYEYYSDGGWLVICPMWTASHVYRVKPEPPKPREWWINVYPENYSSIAHKTEGKANQNSSCERIACSHVREVIDND